jgi:ABC-type multidrug transport system ATPase subunit
MMKTHRFSDLNIDRSNMILIDKNKNNLSQYFGTNKRVPVIEEFCNSIILVYKGYTICNGGLKEIGDAIRKMDQKEYDEQIQFYPDKSARIIRYD